MVGNEAKFIEQQYKGPGEGGDPKGLPLEFPSLRVFMSSFAEVP